MNAIKEYLHYKKVLKAYQSIELDAKDKVILETIDKELIKKISDGALSFLVKEMLASKLDEQYVMGYKQWLIALSSYIRNYNNKNK